VDGLHEGCSKNCFTRLAASQPTTAVNIGDRGSCWADSSSSLGESGSGLTTFPWSWAVWPETDELAVECPSARESIGHFSVVNVIAAFVMAIFGNSAIR
jgi:hypothetical protein